MKRVVEITVMVVTIAVTLSLVGFLLYSGLVVGTQEPDLQVRVDEMRRQGGGSDTEVRMSITNEGGTSVSSVTVEARATLVGGAEETARLTFDYVPQGSTRRGAVRFAGQIRPDSLRTRITAFELP